MAHSQNLNKSTSGVPQVGIPFPTLFKIYISEITVLPKDVQISTYADDITWHNLLFNLNNQTPPTKKHPKTLEITFDPFNFMMR